MIRVQNGRTKLFRMFCFCFGIDQKRRKKEEYKQIETKYI